MHHLHEGIAASLQNTGIDSQKILSKMFYTEHLNI